MTILGRQKDAYEKSIRKTIFLLVAGLVAVAAVNVLLTVFRTDRTHAAFLTVNVVTDILFAWTAIAVLRENVLPRKKLLALYLRGLRGGRTLSCKVVRIAEKPIRIQGFCCCPVTVERENERLELYLIENGIVLHRDTEYALGLVEDLIYRAEVVS